MNSEGTSSSPEDNELVIRVGPLEIDWPQSVGYFGGIALAVAYELIEPPVAIFIAAIPLLKMLKYPGRPRPVRIVADMLEGAAKPVGGDAESTVRVATSGTGAKARTERRQRPRRPTSP